MAVANGAILRIVVSLLFPENVIAQNVFYAIFQDTGASNDEDDVITDLGTWIEDMYDTMANQLSLDTSLTGHKVYVYDSGDADWDEVGDGLLSDSFAGAGDILPHGVSLVMHAKTTDPDVQAAKFIGGMNEATTTDGLFIAGPLAAAVLFAVDWSTDFVGAATGGDFEVGVWSVKNTAFYNFSGVEVINVIPGYQRRRKPGVGI